MQGFTPKQLNELGVYLMSRADSPPRTLRIMLHEMPAFGRPMAEALFNVRADWRNKGFRMKMLAKRMIRESKQQVS